MFSEDAAYGFSGHRGDIKTFDLLSIFVQKDQTGINAADVDHLQLGVFGSVFLDEFLDLRKTIQTSSAARFQHGRVGVGGCVDKQDSARKEQQHHQQEDENCQQPGGGGGRTSTAGSPGGVDLHHWHWHWQYLEQHSPGGVVSGVVFDDVVVVDVDDDVC